MAKGNVNFGFLDIQLYQVCGHISSNMVAKGSFYCGLSYFSVGGECYIYYTISGEKNQLELVSIYKGNKRR